MDQVIVKPANKKQIEAILAKVKGAVAEECNLLTESVEVREIDLQQKESKSLKKHRFRHFKDG